MSFSLIPWSPFGWTEVPYIRWGNSSISAREGGARSINQLVAKEGQNGCGDRGRENDEQAKRRQ
jgi:hypothetical protein